MTFCDTHIHLLAPEWSEPPEPRLEQANAAGIELLLQPGVRSGDWPALLELCADPAVYAAPGLHPFCADQWDAARARQLRQLCAQPKVIAIGEIGLDSLVEVDLDTQRRAFTGQLEIAGEVGLPILIHCRKQTAAVLELLAAHRAERIGGIWHGFSGSIETARRILDLGFALGIGPVLLRNNARKLPETLRQVPAEALVLETDAPDMAAGPAALLRVAERLAELRSWTLAETARITTANVRRILKLEDRTT